MGIVKAEVSDAPMDGAPGTVGAPHAGVIPVAASSGVVGVRHVLWRGNLMPAQTVLEAGELMHDGQAMIPAVDH